MGIRYKKLEFTEKILIRIPDATHLRIITVKQLLLKSDEFLKMIIFVNNCRTDLFVFLLLTPSLIIK